MIFRNSTNTSNNKGYWLASRSFTNGWYNVRLIDVDDFLWEGCMFYAPEGSPDGRSIGVCPVVSLKLNIQTTGQDENGAWQLKVD